MANNGGVYLGCIYEEIFNTYNGNLTSQYKPAANEDQSLLKMPDDVEKRGVNYSQMVLYVILAFQEFYNQNYLTLLNNFNSLKATVTSMQTQINNMQTIITTLVNK